MAVSLIDTLVQLARQNRTVSFLLPRREGLLLLPPEH